jgi:mannose-1-phosphate guanylyltransferase / mannose-6-phosphate isomerase
MPILIPTILCGGAGSRLWPVSREQHPKPFIRLQDNQSFLQKAFLRGAVLPDVTEVITVTNRELLFKTKDDYAEVNKAGLATSYVLEPFGRNTAPAVAFAALLAQKKYGAEAILLVLAADHLIAKQDAFAVAVSEAVSLAAAGKIVTFGIEPTTPETGYGYIEANGSAVVKFVEKPTLDVAKSYLASGKYLWNSGMFCFAAGTMLAEMRAHCPALLASVEACLAASTDAKASGYEQLDLQTTLFADVPDISIDYAVMEKTSLAAVVPCNIGWSDIGSWDAIGSLEAGDNAGNRIEGDALLHDVKNCYIQSNHRMVGAVGVNNLVIIDTPDALLVADRARAQDVKHIYAALKADGHESHKLHRTVHRPWGTYTVLEDGSLYKIKRIEVKPGASLSLQMHHHRSEHWIVVEGVANVVNGEADLVLKANQSTYIPAGNKHRLQNTTDKNLVLIEVQCGSYLGEDDIVRFQDIYGRAETVTAT